MLYSLKTNSYIKEIPYKKEFDVWKSRLTEEQYNSIVDELNNRIDNDEIHTSSWIPGSDWRGTVFQPIYENACNKNVEAAAKFFGLILYQVIIDREEVWSFGHYDKDGVPIKGLTYFKLDKVP
ncbi:MAG: hypothetical protein ACOCRK_09960 [bacterium]